MAKKKAVKADAAEALQPYDDLKLSYKKSDDQVTVVIKNGNTPVLQSKPMSKGHAARMAGRLALNLKKTDIEAQIA